MIAKYLLGCVFAYMSGVAVCAITRGAKYEPEKVGNWTMWLLLLMAANTANLIWFLS